MIIKSSVLLPASSGIAKDTIQNEFIVATDANLVQATIGEVTIPIVNFYNQTAPGATFDIASYLSISISRAASACQIKCYDITNKLDGSPHGSPFAIDSFTLDSAGNNAPMPREVALCVTERGFGWDTALVEQPDADAPADGKVDRPRQRRSGRFYLGPLDTMAQATIGTENRPAVAFRDNVRLAFQDLHDELQVNGHQLVVWSRKDAAVNALVRVETDDAWDTQRRRGAQPTVRTSSVVA